MSATVDLISAVVLRVLRACKILPPASGPPAGSAAETQSKWLLKRAELNTKDRGVLEAFEEASRDPGLPQQITQHRLAKMFESDPVLLKRVALLMAYGFIASVQEGRHPAWAITDEYEPWMPGPPHPHTQFQNP